MVLEDGRCAARASARTVPGFWVVHAARAAVREVAWEVLLDERAGGLEEAVGEELDIHGILEAGDAGCFGGN